VNRLLLIAALVFALPATAACQGSVNDFLQMYDGAKPISGNERELVVMTTMGFLLGYYSSVIENGPPELQAGAEQCLRSFEANDATRIAMGLLTMSNADIKERSIVFGLEIVASTFIASKCEWGA
jgi:hypothetical protein